jgi:biopolymer transport protein ExbB/TolQ
MGIKLLLAHLSDMLLYPVLIVLLLVAAWMAISIGIFFRAWLTRLRAGRPAVARYRGDIDTTFGQPGDDLDIRLESLVQDAEDESTRSLNKVRFAVRVGPSLGLMGTLIPMASALGGLARGDLPALADNMIVAFSSTIVGIAVGVVAYLLTLVREAWTRSDLQAIRAHAERTLRRSEAGR